MNIVSNLDSCEHITSLKTKLNEVIDIINALLNSLDGPQLQKFLMILGDIRLEKMKQAAKENADYVDFYLKKE
jgi:flagellin-specific chaperone FliS